MAAHKREGEDVSEQEFIDGYCGRSGVTWAELSQHYVALPCACEQEYCEGWAMVSNDPHAIQTHMELYAPEGNS
jgi:hypothetical protein